jgi:hypothetical protein
MFLIALALFAVDPPPRPMSVDVIRDPITDAIRAYAVVRERGDRLVVSCDPERFDGPRVSFHARRWLARGNLFSGARPVTYRFDEGPPRRMLWDVENRHATLSSRSRVAAFLADLVVAEKLVIRTRDIENHRYDLSFRLVDVRPAVEQALAACAGTPPREGTQGS